MDSEIILKNEEENDGSTIYLYYNDEVGFYTAYGYSAFLVTHVIEPVCSYSPSLKLPVVLVNKYQIMELRRSLKKIKHLVQSFYQFGLRKPVGKSGYARWTNGLK